MARLCTGTPSNSWNYQRRTFQSFANSPHGRRFFKKIDKLYRDSTSLTEKFNQKVPIDHEVAEQLYDLRSHLIASLNHLAKAQQIVRLITLSYAISSAETRPAENSSISPRPTAQP